jgi:hypothetical protein
MENLSYLIGPQKAVTPVRQDSSYDVTKMKIANEPFE